MNIETSTDFCTKCSAEIHFGFGKSISGYLCTKCYFGRNTKKRGKETCRQCGKTFKKRTVNNIFCTRNCSNIFNKIKSEKTKRITHFDIFERDSFACQYCGRTPKDGAVLVIDHVYPLSRGGSSEFFNMVTSCRECNGSKSNRIMVREKIIRLWNNAKGEFTYEEAKEYWGKTEKHRKNRYIRKSLKLIKNNDAL